MKENFTSSQVSQRTGLTPRQLQWWDEQGIVVPARQGHHRLYSARDLAELAILCDLRRRGFSLQRIRKMMSVLRREFGHRLADLLSRGAGLHLLTDGESVFLRDSERGVIDLLRDTQQPLLAICIGPLLERVLAPPVAGVAPESVPLNSIPRVSSQAPKKSSQPVRAVRAKARPSAGSLS